MARRPSGGHCQTSRSSPSEHLSGGAWDDPHQMVPSSRPGAGVQHGATTVLHGQSLCSCNCLMSSL